MTFINTFTNDTSIHVSRASCFWYLPHSEVNDLPGKQNNKPSLDQVRRPCLPGTQSSSVSSNLICLISWQEMSLGKGCTRPCFPRLLAWVSLAINGLAAGPGQHNHSPYLTERGSPPPGPFSNAALHLWIYEDLPFLWVDRTVGRGTGPLSRFPRLSLCISSVLAHV